MTAAIAPFSAFVTGTDTEIGKTLVASSLVSLQARAGIRVIGMKPVAAGGTLRGGVFHNDDLDALRAAAPSQPAVQLQCPYLFPEPIAPHLAAALAGSVIDRDVILSAYRQLRATHDAVIVEGVGGFRVPLSPSYDAADLAHDLRLPVVLVVGLRLGCLNHALLTYDAIEARGLYLAAWVANTVDPAMGALNDNIDTLRQRLPAPCLGVIPRHQGITPEQASAYLDLEDVLS
jgi:dethiobiotin synthetase